MKPDFSGYASKANLLCSDGRTIKPHAFKGNDGKRVPLIWDHGRNDPKNVLGYAEIEDRPDGAFVRGYFNNTDSGKHMKEAVEHGDVDALSIFADKLVHNGADVVKGRIQEVSLVISGANPGASIQNITISHSDGMIEERESEAIIFTGLNFEHSDSSDESEEDDTDLEHAEEGTVVSDTNTKDKKVEDSETSIADILNTLNEDQMKAVAYVVEEALKVEPVIAEADDNDDDEDDTVSHSDLDENDADAADTDQDDSDADDANADDAEDDAEDTNDDTVEHSDQEENNMSRNLFDSKDETNVQKNTLTHSQLETIVNDAKRFGSLKDSVLQHAAEYGFENVDLLFPDAKNLANSPEILSRRMEWVSEVIDNTYHSPFARIRSTVADITAEEARARGYVKGSKKKDEIIKLLRRKTSPTTVYKKQRLDRDDMLDITDFDVVAWLKAEMRIMLDEELARAILLGDGRDAVDDDKIDEDSIRPIAYDDAMYAHKVVLPSNFDVKSKIEAMIRARSHYKGSGAPVLFTTQTFLTDMLLDKDKMGRRIYTSVDDLASQLMARKIVAVEVMEEYPDVQGIYVNLSDYAVGTDKGGQISMFDDFDINYNQHHYLLETRASGALRKPKSAVVVLTELGTVAVPTQPSFAAATNTITIPTVTGVRYIIDEAVVTGNQVITGNTTVIAQALSGYRFESGTDTEWDYTYTTP